MLDALRGDGDDLDARMTGPSGRSPARRTSERRLGAGGGTGARAGAGAMPVIVFAGATLTGIALSANVAVGRPILASRWSLLGELGLWAAAWALAVVAALRLPVRWAVGAVVAAAVVLRVAALLGPPTTSDDLYRYAWDGRVQATGIDPYAEPPAAEALVGLREGWLWPDVRGCAAIERPTGCTRINRPPARTIYPPIAEAWFSGVYRVAGIGARHKAWQVAGLATESVVLALLPLALRRWGRDPRWCALYALCPAPVLEIVNNAHVDGLAIALVVAALVVMVPPPGRGGRLSGPWRDVAAGLLIAAAALVKLYPAVLLVALVGAGRGRRIPILARAGAAAAGLAVATYLPHVVSVGPKVLGYLPGYFREEHYHGGGRFLLAGAAHIPAGAAGAVSLCCVAGVVAWVLARRPPAPIGCAAVLSAVILATSPVQPWYAAGVVALAAVAAEPWWVAVMVAGYPYFFGLILDYRHVLGLGRVAYGAGLAVIVAGVGLGARQRRAQGESSSWSTPSAVPATTT